MAKKTVTKKPSRLTEIYLAEKKAGRGLGSAVSKAALEKIDPRQFFNQKGLLANILPSFFKTYKAPTGTTPRPKPATPITPTLSSSVLENKVDALSEETRLVGVNSRITAKNTLVLPMIARDMNLMRQNIFRLVKRQTGAATNKSDMFFAQAAGREVAYESKFRREGGVKSLMSPTPSTSDSSNVVGGVLSTLGGLFKGALSGAGSLFGGLASVVGGVIGGIGGFLGGAAKGIFNVISGALGSAGILGILAAAGIGYILHQMYQNLDLTDIKKKLGLENFSFENVTKEISSIVEGLKQKADEITGGKFTETLNFIKNTFTDIATKTMAVVQTGMQIMTNVFIAAIKDFQGFSENIYRENKATILASIAALGTLSTLGIGAFTPKGLAILAGVTTLAGAYGKMTGEKSLTELESELSQRQKQVEDVKKELTTATPSTKRGLQDELSRAQQAIPILEKQIEEKKGKTNNFQTALAQASSPTALYEQNVSNLSSTSPSPVPPQAGRGFNRAPGANIKLDDEQTKMAGLIFDRFKQAGFTDQQANAAVVNAYAESKLRPQAKSPVTPKEESYGLFQMNTKGGLGQGHDPQKLMDPNYNITLAIDAAKKSKMFVSSKSLDEAIKAFTIEVERPANMLSEAQKRVDIASSVLGKSPELPTASPPMLASSEPAPSAATNMFHKVKTALRIDSEKVNAATIQVSQARIQIGSAPIVVAPPTVNVQAPQIQGGTGGFGAMASSSVVDTEFMKLLVGRTVTL